MLYIVRWKSWEIENLDAVPDEVQVLHDPGQIVCHDCETWVHFRVAIGVEVKNVLACVVM
jgi:hypothetical protein